MKSKFLGLLLLLLSVFTANAQTAKLVEKVAKSSTALIPYEKYVLPNGLTVIISEDHSDPIVYVNVTYHVGSSRELYGRSGFAHFFEHMMFEGSAHAPDGVFDQMTEGCGGYNNGSTWNDYTNYYEMVPNNELERMLWLESDRMGFLLDAVTQTKFDIQRATVKNERGQNVDNRPYGLVDEKVGEALYPFGHPYSWPVIGYMADLDRADLNDLKRFFLRWYSPNNATLTITGDVNPADAIKMVEKYFSPIPQGPAVQNLPKTPVSIDKDRYISYEDNVEMPLLNITWPTVNVFHEDAAPLDALAGILSGSKSSILYQAFEKNGLASSTEAYNNSVEIHGYFNIAIYAMPGKSLADIESKLRNTLLDFEKRGVTDVDLMKFKAQYEADAINSLTGIDGKGEALALYQTYTGNPNYSTQHLNAYLNVTKEDIMRVYNKYIKGKPAVILSVCPKGEGKLKAAADNFTPPAAPSGYKADLIEYTSLTYTQPTDNFDRAVVPTAGANPVIKVPAVYKEDYDNGLRILGNQTDELPTVTMYIVIKAGHVMESLDKSGLARLTANMLNQSTQNYSTEKMADELDKLGSTIVISSGKENITITVNSLKKNIDATLKLLEEKLLKPKFDAADFKVEKTLLLSQIANANNYASTVATNVYAKLVYGADHIFSMPVYGNKKTVDKLTLADVKNFYAKYYAPDMAQMVVVGDISKDDILTKTAFMKSWPQKGLVGMPSNEIATHPDKTRIYLVNKAGAPQSEIRIGYMGIQKDPVGEFYKATIMLHPFGGSFASRINLKQREVKGWTYGTRAWLGGTQYNGPFTVSAGIKTPATDSSVVEFMKDLKLYADSGITPTELAFTKNSLGQASALKYETPGDKAMFLADMLEYNLDTDFVDKQTDILNKITKADIDALTKKYIPYNNMYIVVVGDKAKIYEPLKKLGYEIIELDMNGVKK
jgi:zinc protease